LPRSRKENFEGSRISNPASSIAFRIGPTFSVATPRKSARFRVFVPDGDHARDVHVEEPMIAASCAEHPGRSGRDLEAGGNLAHARASMNASSTIGPG